MKRLLIMLALLLVGSIVSAKQFTVQFKPVRHSYYGWGEKIDKQINAYLDKGYKIVSMIPVVDYSRTIYIVVVFDDME